MHPGFPAQALESAGTGLLDGIAYVAVAAWMAYAPTQNVLLVLPEDIKTLKRITRATGQGNDEKGNFNLGILPANAWQMFSQVVVPMDSVKSLDKRRGWTAAQLERTFRE